jgi:hypothetical protein
LISFNAPEGFLINGKISVVDTAGITVAIKTLADEDPSASDPVYCRIDGVVRSITSALSVAKADGTNWMNAGSSELATQEIDYFVYLGYNATDGVVIGFSRYPGAGEYGDFSDTTTDEKYCAISTITNAAATDYYNVIGRFAATLSAGAGYTWSVPTFTAKNLIQRPIYETRWLEVTPIFTGFSTDPTTYNFRYKLVSDLLSMVYYGNTGTSDQVYFRILSPFKGGSNIPAYDQLPAQVIDAGVVQTTPGLAVMTPGSNIINFYKNYSGGSGVFTNSGSKGGSFPTLIVEI